MWLFESLQPISMSPKSLVPAGKYEVALESPSWRKVFRKRACHLRQVVTSILPPDLVIRFISITACCRDFCPIMWCRTATHIPKSKILSRKGRASKSAWISCEYLFFALWSNIHERSRPIEILVLFWSKTAFCPLPLPISSPKSYWFNMPWSVNSFMKVIKNSHGWDRVRAKSTAKASYWLKLIHLTKTHGIE